jgi:hypothetical protein
VAAESSYHVHTRIVAADLCSGTHKVVALRCGRASIPLGADPQRLLQESALEMLPVRSTQR